MSEQKNVEIRCTACSREALLVRKPKYDGFKKAGEELTCSTCGHVYATEQDVPFKARSALNVFTAADHSRKIELFAEGENSRLCRYCAHYIVNPFRQWCAQHRRDVEATDSCDRFAACPPEKPADAGAADGARAAPDKPDLRKLLE